MKIAKLKLAIKNIIRINIFKTIYLNFSLLPFCDAVKLPINAYGKVKIHSLKGECIIKGKVSFGMIKIGYRWIDLVPSSFIPTQILINGKVIFNGPIILGGGVAFFSQSVDSIIDCGKNIVLSSGVFIKSVNFISIGDNSRCTFNSVIMDSNMHYVKNIDTGEIKKPWGPIYIGKNCWVNSGTIITKGANIPDFSIVSRNSFINKDFSSYGKNLFIVGAPAKVVTSVKVQRIFDSNHEIQLKKTFLSDDNLDIIKEPIGVIEDDKSLFI